MSTFLETVALLAHRPEGAAIAALLGAPLLVTAVTGFVEKRNR